MPIQKKHKRRFAALLASVCVLSGLGCLSYAAWQVTSGTWNYVTTPSFGLNIEEDYEPPEGGALPGVEIDKKVRFRNTGDTQEMVRARLTRLIGTKNEEGKLVPNESLEPEAIILNTNDTDWIYEEDEDYYYYKGVLEPGEETPELLYSFHLREDVPNTYKRKDCQIIVEAESVQYRNNGCRIWEKDYSYFSVEDPGPEILLYPEETSVTFLSPRSKFDIELAKPDLFENFKDLLPGSARTQTVKVKNAYKEPVTMSLSAMDLDENLKEKEPLVYSLLQEQISAIITDDTGKIVYEGGLGGPESDFNLPLGRFKSGEEKRLTVRIAVKPEMGNDFQELMGRVRWEFTANEIVVPVKERPTLYRMVKTGELPFFLIGILLIAFGCYTYKRQKNEA